MTDEVHPLVELLVARAKSHPEEFNEERNPLTPTDRWWRALDTVSRSGTDADKAVIASTVGRIAMDKAHEWALDELLNGDERREIERREREEMEKRYAAQAVAMSQRPPALSQFAQAQQSAYQNALGGASISGFTSQVTAIDSLSLGGETLTAGMIQQIKKALGVK